MIVLVLMVVAQPPQAPPMEMRVSILEQKVQKLEQTVYKTSAPKAAIEGNPSFNFQKKTTAADFTNPTYHYDPPANFKVEAGAVVLDRQPSHISYPGGPMTPLPQAAASVYSTPPVQVWSPPMMFNGGGSCTVGPDGVMRCGPSQGGRRGLFRRR